MFSHYVADRLSQGPVPELRKVFAYVETKLTGDDSALDNAFCTCFLENLMNRVPGSIAPASLVSLLGPKARDYCRGYDEWCGTKTDGLW